jgi:hypothetical protein
MESRTIWRNVVLRKSSGSRALRGSGICWDDAQAPTQTFAAALL